MQLCTRYRRALIGFSASALTLTMSAQSVGQTILRVDADSTATSPDGLSWGTAYTYLADAIAEAVSAGGSHQIWVRGSTTGITYKPDQGAGLTAGDQTLSFELASNVAIYGGFNGDEPPGIDGLRLRNPEVNITILSGDLDDDDTADFGNRSDNSLHVVTADGVGVTARLDGFVIRGGSAVSAYPDGNGGGILVTAGSPSMSARSASHLCS